MHSKHDTYIQKHASHTHMQPLHTTENERNNVHLDMPHTNRLEEKGEERKIGYETFLNERRYEKKQLPSKKNSRSRVLRQLEI